MDQQLTPAELLRFLQGEAETLQQMQAKISNELHHLQVEEEVFVRTIDRLNQNAATNRSDSTMGNAGVQTRHQAGLELLQALQQELVSTVPPVSTLPPDSALPSSAVHPPPDSTLPTSLHAFSAAETGANVAPQSAGPSGIGFDDDENEYELLERLESEGDKL